MARLGLLGFTSYSRTAVLKSNDAKSLRFIRPYLCSPRRSSRVRDRPSGGGFCWVQQWGAVGNKTQVPRKQLSEPLKTAQVLLGAVAEQRATHCLYNNVGRRALFSGGSGGSPRRRRKEC